MRHDGGSPRERPYGAAHVSTTRVAEVLGVSRRTVSRWCKAKDHPIEATRLHERAPYRVDRAWYEREADRTVSVSRVVQPIRRHR